MTAISTLPYGRAGTVWGGHSCPTIFAILRALCGSYFYINHRGHREHRGTAQRKLIQVGFGDYCCFHVISTLTGMSFLIGMVSRVGGSILKSVSLEGMVPVIFFSFPCAETWNGTSL